MVQHRRKWRNGFDKDGREGRPEILRFDYLAFEASPAFRPGPPCNSKEYGPSTESSARRTSGALLDRYSEAARKRFFAKAFPDPDLKYRSRLRAVASSPTAT